MPHGTELDADVAIAGGPAGTLHASR